MKHAKLILSIVLFVCSFLALVAAASPSWTLLGPSGLTFPLFRNGSTTVYDPSSNRVILFAGSSDDVGNPRLNDVWVQTNANGLGGTGAWSQLIPSGTLPQVRSQHSAVYDAANNRMIIYGGCGAVPTSNGCLPIADNAWVLSNANGLGGTPSWTQLFPTGGPPPARQSHQAVYDPTTNSMIVWAGQNGGGFACNPDIYSDVWVLSHANGLGGTPNWTQLSTTGGPPPGQYSSTAVYDSTNNVLTVFGGTGLLGTHCGPTNAVWALSHANGTGGTPVWTNLVPQGAPDVPSNRSATLAVYELNTNTMTIFGGNAKNGALNDSWVLSHANGIGGTSTWTKLSPSGNQPVKATRWNNGGYDGVNNRMIMFGGSFSEGPLWSTWILTDANGQ